MEQAEQDSRGFQPFGKNLARVVRLTCGNVAAKMQESALIFLLICEVGDVLFVI